MEKTLLRVIFHSLIFTLSQVLARCVNHRYTHDVHIAEMCKYNFRRVSMRRETIASLICEAVVKASDRRKIRKAAHVIATSDLHEVYFISLLPERDKLKLKELIDGGGVIDDD